MCIRDSPYTLGRFCIRKAYAQLRSFEGLDSSYRSLQYAWKITGQQILLSILRRRYRGSYPYLNTVRHHAEVLCRGCNWRFCKGLRRTDAAVAETGRIYRRRSERNEKIYFGQVSAYRMDHIWMVVWMPAIISPKIGQTGWKMRILSLIWGQLSLDQKVTTYTK